MKTKSMLSRVSDYIAYRRNFGITDKNDNSLKKFADFADSRHPGKPLTIRMAIEWAMIPSIRGTRAKSRVDRLRGFAKYLKIHDPRTELLPTRLLEKKTHRFEPYIMTNDEMYRFITTKSYVMTQNISEYSIRTIIGLLICTGMRIGEVLHLNNRDVDLKNEIIYIKNSKRKKIRSIPVDQSTANALRTYKNRRNSFYPGVETERFFFLDGGRPIAYVIFFRRWQTIWRKIRDKSGDFAKKCPRIHDIRHTFACNHLLDAYKQKKDIDHELHLLSVYLGHASVVSTYWYLTATPELLEYASRSFEESINQQQN